jgi:3-phenylpropionate/trans-cinnamate dioxygenase ferredoxin component
MTEQRTWTDGFVLVAQMADIPDGELISVDGPDGEPVCLANVGGVIYALHDSCPHQEFPISSGAIMNDGTIECPLHGARFDARTGRVCLGPAVDDVARYRVRVEGDMILVGPRV